VFDRISQALARGQRVELRGFGTFSTKKARPYFKASRKMHDRLNRPA
jgi:nucleoid DNA-binding protein